MLTIINRLQVQVRKDCRIGEVIHPQRPTGAPRVFSNTSRFRTWERRCLYVKRLEEWIIEEDVVKRKM